MTDLTLKIVSYHYSLLLVICYTWPAGCKSAIGDHSYMTAAVSGEIGTPKAHCTDKLCYIDKREGDT